MSSRYGILSILLFFIVLILAYENYALRSSPSATTLRKESGKKGEAKPESPPPAVTPKETVPREAFNVIAEKNIFSPERKEFSSAAAAAMAKPVARPPITLYGVVIAEDYQIASIINPGRPLYKGEREMKSLKIGDMVGEYKLTKIMPDRILLEAGEDSFEVLLYDPRTPKKRVEVKTPTQPATITSTAPTPTPPVVAPGIQPVAPASPAPTPGVVPSPPVRPVSPLSVPRAPGVAAEAGSPTPGVSPALSPSAPPDPGIWRGRRPITSSPGSAPGQERQ
jgi:hypothetical protein